MGFGFLRLGVGKFCLLVCCCWSPKEVMAEHCSESVAQGRLWTWGFVGELPAEVAALHPLQRFGCSGSVLQVLVESPAHGDLCQGLCRSRDVTSHQGLALQGVASVWMKNHLKKLAVKDTGMQGYMWLLCLSPNESSVLDYCLALLPNVTWIRIKTRFLMVCNHITSHNGFWKAVAANPSVLATFQLL